MKRSILTLVVWVASCLVCSYSSASIQKEVLTEKNNIEDIELRDLDGVSMNISELPAGRKIIVLTWEFCNDCTDHFPYYQSIVSLYDNQGIEIIFLWKDDIPKKADLLFGSIKHYATDDISKLTNWVPSYILTDENNITQEKTSDFEWIIDYLSGVYSYNANSMKSWIGDHLILFTLDGCSSCIEAELRLHSELKSDRLRTVLNGSSKNHNQYDFYDPYMIYANALDILYLPKFVLLNDDEIVIYDSIESILDMGY